MIGFCSGIPVAIAVVCSITCALPVLVARCHQGSHAAVDMEPDGVDEGSPPMTQEEKWHEDYGNIGDAREHCCHGQSSSGEHPPREL
jgi:hypothetical protein